MDKPINQYPLYDVAARAMLGVAVLLWMTAGIIDQWVDVTSYQNDTIFNNAHSNFTSTTSSRTEHFGIFKSELKGALSGKSNWTTVFNDCENGFDIGVYSGSQLRGTSDSCQTECENKKWLFWVSLVVAGVVFVGSGQMGMLFMRGREQFYPRLAAFVLLLFVVCTSWYLFGLVSTGMSRSVDGHFPSAANGIEVPQNVVNVTYPADFGICDFKLDEDFINEVKNLGVNNTYIDSADDPEAAASFNLWLSGCVLITVATVMLLFDKTHGEDSRTIYSPLGEHLMR